MVCVWRVMTTTRPGQILNVGLGTNKTALYGFSSSGSGQRQRLSRNLSWPVPPLCYCLKNANVRNYLCLCMCAHACGMHALHLGVPFLRSALWCHRVPQYRLGPLKMASKSGQFKDHWSTLNNYSPPRFQNGSLWQYFPAETFWVEIVDQLSYNPTFLPPENIHV